MSDSGKMSRRRCKHVLQSSLQDEVKPPAAHQSIVRAVGSRGGNHVEVGDQLLSVRSVLSWQQTPS